MKQWILLLCLLLAGCAQKEEIIPVETAAMVTEASTEPAVQPSTEPATQPATEPPAEPPTETTLPEPVYAFTPEEETLLLKLAMAERGDTGCETCMALVMRTVLNRAEGPKFSSTIRGVVYAEGQFTPAMDGSLETAVPDSVCYDALELIRYGWDDSQGALYYEWCQGESWHSRNLNLLLQHCDTRFYN